MQNSNSESKPYKVWSIHIPRSHFVFMLLKYFETKQNNNNNKQTNNNDSNNKDNFRTSNRKT